MNIPLITLQNLYDWSLIEKAFQSFCVAYGPGPFSVPTVPMANGEEVESPDGLVPIYTAKDVLTFQLSRPRVWTLLHSVNEMENVRVVTPDNVLRAAAWRGQLKIGFVTKVDYNYHTQLRALVLALIPACQPNISPDNSLTSSTGLNSILQYHEVGLFQAQNASTTITPQEGYFRSDLQVNLQFSVRRNQWPAGTN